MAKIFVSHSSKDKDFVRKLCSDLVALGHEPWLDEWAIRVGECIVSGVESGIAGADYVVVVLSPNSCSSQWVEREWKAKYWDEIQQRQTRVLPVLIADCEIPTLLKTKLYADFRTNYSLGLVSLMAGISPVMRSSDKAFQHIERPSHTDEVSALLAAIQSQVASLAKCMADGLQLARKIGDADLERFCRRELEGWPAKAVDAADRPPHRSVEMYISPSHEINMQYFGWGQNSANIFAMIRDNPEDFMPVRMFVNRPVADVEEQAKVSPDPTKAVISFRSTLRQIIPSAQEDGPIFVYGHASMYCTVLSNIRREFTSKLLRILPQIESDSTE